MGFTEQVIQLNEQYKYWGSGSTMFTWMWSKRRSGNAKLCSCALVCR